MSRGSFGRNWATAGSSVGPKSGPSWMRIGPSLWPSSRARSKNSCGEIVHVAQAPLVGDLLRKLEREDEIVGRSARPPANRLRHRARVEGRIDLHRIEGAGVDGEEIRRSCVVRIERTDPRVVIPPLRPDSNPRGHTMESVRATEARQVCDRSRRSRSCAKSVRATFQGKRDERR